MSTTNKIIFDFSTNSDTSRWQVVDDGVMGGLSQGNFKVEDGQAVYEGDVSLENNGGFSSLRYNPAESVMVDDHKYLTLHVKGDGSKYQARIKHNRSDYYSYVYDFKTDGKNQIIKIPLAEMKPTFRGRDLNMGLFQESEINQVAILIGNKKEQDFKLCISKIELTKS